MLKAAKASPWLWVVLSGLGCAMLIFALWRSIWSGPEPVANAETGSGKQQQKKTPARSVSTDSLDDEPLKIAAALSMASQQLSQRISKSVVRIDTQGSISTAARMEQLTRLFGQVNFRPGPQQGSGVIVDESGYILTNYHVVWSADVIHVGLPDGRTVNAVSVGSDLLTDLALLKVEADGLTAARWGESQDLRAGALVWAVGSPFGLERSVTMGIISAIDRPGVGSTPYADLLQTDAAVNPGNSGGPLVNIHGDVIGINTAIVGEAYRGIGFAIPGDTARSVYEQLRQRKSVERGWLGVGLGQNPKPTTRPDQAAGAVIREVMAGATPARAAGLRVGDIVLAWNDVSIRSPVQLSRLIAQTPAGTQVRLRVQRGGDSVLAKVVVGSPP